MRATLDGRILWRTETRVCVRCGEAFEAQHGRKGRAPSHCLECRLHPPAKRIKPAARAPLLTGRRDGDAFVLEVRVYGMKEAARVAAKIQKEVLGC